MNLFKNVSELATAANGSKKPNKKEAVKLFENLLFSNDETSKRVAATALYTFFLPPAPAKAKTAEQWINKAVAKKDVRFYLNNAYKDQTGRLIGCDGHRMHYVKDQVLEPGYYDAAMNKVDIEARYPDIDRIIPDRDVYNCLGLDELKLDCIEKTKDGTYCYKIDDCIYINKKYLDDALSGFNDGCIYFKGASDTITIEDNARTRLAIVMPLRFDN